MSRLPTFTATFVVLIALASTVGAAQNPPLDARVKTLNSIFSDYWEDLLKHQPDFASSIGDNRYNDQLPDYSVQAYNESLARGRAFLSRLTEVDAAGMTDQEQLSKDLLVANINRESTGSQVQAMGVAG